MEETSHYETTATTNIVHYALGNTHLRSCGCIHFISLSQENWQIHVVSHYPPPSISDHMMQIIEYFRAISQQIIIVLSSDNLLYRLRKKDKAYADSITFQIVETVSEAARLAAVCYVLDTVEVALEVTGIKGKKVDFSSLLAKLIFATWAGLRTRMYKRRFFANLVNFTPKQLNGRKGILEVFDKTSDFFGFGILALVWTDILKIKGHGLSSIFALGGFGTLTLTLACQDLAKRALNGLALSASDSFEVGDQILLGDGELNVYVRFAIHHYFFGPWLLMLFILLSIGTSGTVINIGWLTTEILGMVS